MPTHRLTLTLAFLIALAVPASAQAAPKLLLDADSGRDERVDDTSDTTCRATESGEWW